jgi:hypothetical protein
MKSFARSLVLLVALVATLGSSAASRQAMADLSCDEKPVQERAECHAAAQAQYVEDRQEELAQEQADRDRQQADRAEQLAEEQRRAADEHAQEQKRAAEERSLDQRCGTVVARMLACGKADADRALTERSYCKAALQSTDARAYARTVCLENNSDCAQIDGCFAATTTAAR